MKKEINEYKKKYNEYQDYYEKLVLLLKKHIEPFYENKKSVHKHFCPQWSIDNIEFDDNVLYVSVYEYWGMGGSDNITYTLNIKNLYTKKELREEKLKRIMED